MSSNLKKIQDFGHCQETWFDKSAATRYKLSLWVRISSFAVTTFVTFLLLFDTQITIYIAAGLSWVGGVLTYFLEESKTKELAEQERVIAEKLRVLNAQYSGGLLSEKEYSNRLISILTNHIDKYEELIIDND